jgi:hypothetical protein
MKVENIPHPADPLRSYLVSRRVHADEPDTPFPIEVLTKMSKVTPGSGSARH